MATPQKISNILAELMARRGFARVQSTEAYEQAWRDAAGPLAAKYTQVGALKRGTLEVVVANSALVQELTFQKIAILQKLAAELPDEKIRNLRFRVGTID
jgi:predicted nucleic acid-binding Zn ribbon protein